MCYNTNTKKRKEMNKMIKLTPSSKAGKAHTKIQNLSKALTACGIQNDVQIDHDNDIISLNVTLWNCIDGSDVQFGVYAMAAENYEIGSYAEPEGQREALLASWENETK